MAASMKGKGVTRTKAAVDLVSPADFSAKITIAGSRRCHQVRAK